MAATTPRVATPSTTNATSYASGSFTPALNDLLVAMVEYSQGTAVDTAPTMTDSQSLGFTRIIQQSNDNNSGGVAIFIANALCAATPTTVTFHTSNTSTGAIVHVCSVSGMTKTGATAAKQSAGNNGASAVPTSTFSGSALTGNACLSALQGVGSGTGLAQTPPGGWTASGDTGYSTPTIGGEYARIDSGFTGTAVTWVSSLTGRWSNAIVELDTSGSGGSTTPLSMTATSVVVTGSMVRQVNKAVTATAVAATGTIARQVNKTIVAAAVAVTASVGKQVNKTITASAVIVTASLTALKVVLKTMTATSVVVTGSMQRQVGKAMTATSAVTASVRKQVNKAMTASSVAVTASLTSLKVILKTMTATVVVTGSMQRQVGKALTATSAVSATILRQVAKRMTATVAASGSMARRIAKTLTGSVVASASFQKTVAKGMTATSFIGGLLTALRQAFGGRVIAVDVIIGDEPAAPIVAYVQDRVEVRPGETPAAQVIASDIPWFLAAVEEDMVLHKFDFQFDTPGLNNGVAFYTPAVGEVLIGLGIYFKTAWNDTARGDVGQGFTPSFTDFLGFHTGGLYDLTNVDRGGFFTTATELNDNVAVVNPGLGEFGCIYVFNNTDPLKVWVSTTGGRTDPTPAATAGAATLYWVTLTL